MHLWRAHCNCPVTTLKEVFSHYGTRLTNIPPLLTPLSAAGLAAIMVIAMALHARRKEYSAIGFTALLFLMAVFVAYGRWFLVP